MNTAPAPLDPTAYPLPDLAHLETPRLLVYRERFAANLERMREHLESAAPGSGLGHLRPHAKTHKSPWVTRELLARGVEKFKATPHELDVLLEAGAADILVAYPLLDAGARRLARRIRQYPGTSIAATVGSLEHAAILARAAREERVEIDCYLDLDVGEHRTGMAPGGARALLSRARASSDLGGLRWVGLHAYDGKTQSLPTCERREGVRRAMGEVAACLRQVEPLLEARRLVAGGSLDFAAILEELLGRHRVDAPVDVSPGTWVYWDSRYAGLAPGMFDFAALLLAQVMDTTLPGRVTLNMGYKRWGIDQGPLEVFSIPGLLAVAWSEEHTVLEAVPPGEAGHLKVGDPVLAAPRHVCSTVNLWETFVLVGPGGEVEHAALPVSARNR